MMFGEQRGPASSRFLTIRMVALTIVLAWTGELKASDPFEEDRELSTYVAQAQMEAVPQNASEKGRHRQDWVARLRRWAEKFQAAAINGDGTAAYELGRLLLAGPPEIKNHEEGLRWLKSVSTQHFEHEAAPIVYAMLSKFFIDCETLFRKPHLKPGKESLSQENIYAPFYGEGTSVPARILTLQALLVGMSPGNLEIDPGYAPAWVACARAHGVPWLDIEGMSYVSKDVDLGSAIANAANAMKH